MSAAADSNARSAANKAYNAAKAAGKDTKGVWANTYFGKGGAGFKADVVVLKDPSKPATKSNIKAVHDFKFNCSGQKDFPPGQVDKYKECTGKVPKQIFTPGNSFL